MIKDFKLSGVYKITNNINGKFYIGSGNSVFNRWVNHASDLSNGTHTGYKLQRAFDKYGFDNFKFEVLELHSPEGLNLREQYYLDTLCKAQEYIEGKSNFFCNKTYNVKPLVYGITGLPMLEETIVKAIRTRGFEQIYKVSLRGEFLKMYELQKHAAEDNKISRPTVSKSIKSKKPPKNKDYYFVYKSEYDPKYIPIPYKTYNKGKKGLTKDNNIKSVYCYDVYGRYYKKFKSGLSAAEYFAIDPSGISRMLDNPKQKILHRFGVHLYNMFSSEVVLENKLEKFYNTEENGDIEVYTLFHEYLGSYTKKTISKLLSSKENVIQQSITKGKILKGFYFSID